MTDHAIVISLDGLPYRRKILPPLPTKPLFLKGFPFKSNDEVATYKLATSFSPSVLLKISTVPWYQRTTELTGHWQLAAGKMVADDTCRRIQQLISEQLIRIATDSSGWLALYRDPQDSRLWELSYPQGEMQGGGPPKLTCIAKERAIAVFGQAGN